MRGSQGGPPQQRAEGSGAAQGGSAASSGLFLARGQSSGSTVHPALQHPLSPASASTQGSSPSPVSYTHLTLPTTPYV